VLEEPVSVLLMVFALPVVESTKYSSSEREGERERDKEGNTTEIGRADSRAERRER